MSYSAVFESLPVLLTKDVPHFTTVVEIRFVFGIKDRNQCVLDNKMSEDMHDTVELAFIGTGYYLSSEVGRKEQTDVDKDLFLV